MIIYSRLQMTPKVSINNIIRLLERHYGPRRWEPGPTPISVLIGTIISQNTSDANSTRAFETLKGTFESWEDIARADTDKLADAIRCAGLSRIKAERIKQALGHIQKERGSLDLAFLTGLPTSQAKAWLEKLPGVGPKTAACVLMFSLGKPALPVDTHVYRVARRLGLIDSRLSRQRACELLERLVPAPYVYQFHLHLIEHGRKVCKAQRPRCYSCILRRDCLYAQREPTRHLVLSSRT
jgi:endonuclease-3